MQFHQRRPRTEVAAEAFGLERFSIIYNIRRTPHAFVRHIWLATLRGVWESPVTVGRVSYSRLADKRDVDFGVVLIEHPDTEQQNFLGQQPIRSVEVTSTDDPAIHALQHMNMFEKETNEDEMLKQVVGIRMDIEHPNGSRQFYGEFFNDEGDQTWRNLRDALINSIEAFVPLYEDPLMSEYIRTQRKTQW